MTIDPKSIRALLEQATARPWRVIDQIRNGKRDIMNVMGAVRMTDFGSGPEDDSERIIETDGGHYGPEAADADLICAAVNALPELLAVYEAAVAWRDGSDDDDIPLLNDLSDAIDRARSGEVER